MRQQRRAVSAILAAAGAMAIVAAGAAVVADRLRPDPDEVCGGVTRKAGGCEAEQPSFAGTTCAAVGREFGAQVDARGLAIIGGPASQHGESRAVRMGEMLLLVTTRANQHLRDTGQVASCRVDEFVAAAETAFSDPFRAQVGDYLYDGASRPYAEWLDELRRVIVVIDMEEDVPFMPSPTRTAGARPRERPPG
jgi:hypothetical protein